MSTRERRNAPVAVLVLIAASAVTISVTPPPVRADNGPVLTDLVDAAAQRSQVADPVAAFKWHNNTAIEDPARVQQQPGALSADAAAAGVDSDYVITVFTDQIDATEAVEYSRFAQWKLDPGSVPLARTASPRRVGKR